MFRSCISAADALKPVKWKRKQSRKHFFPPLFLFRNPPYWPARVSDGMSLFLMVEIMKKARINCEMWLSDQEKACKRERGGLEWCQRRDLGWAQRKNKDLRKNAMPRLRRVDLKLQGCVQTACIGSLPAPYWADLRSVGSFFLLQWWWNLHLPQCSRLVSGCICSKTLTDISVSLVSCCDNTD